MAAGARRRHINALEKTILGVGEIPPGRETVSGQVYEHARDKGYVRSWRPHGKTRQLIAQVEEIRDLYADQLPLTIRQVFYVLVGRYGYEKTERAYKALTEMLITARRAGRIDWRDLRDDTLTILPPYTRFATERSFFHWLGREYVENFEIDPTVGQTVALEVWCEAAGMTRQLEKVADPYGVTVYSGSGFDSLTAKFETVERIVKRQYEGRGKSTVILRIGDFDPSGRSMIDAFAADVWAFLAEYPLYADGSREDLSDLLDVKAVAVTETQIDEHNLTTAPQKATDKRAGFMARTVQAEALPPDVLADVLKGAIEGELDMFMLQAQRKRGGIEYARVQRTYFPRRWIDRWDTDGEFPPGRGNGDGAP
jgi:hypothetical protein